MTQRLYYLNSYLKEFEAEVVDRADDGRRIYLNQTAFYPTSGGQPFDTGELGGIEVKDVVDEGDRVAHLLAAPLSANRAVGRVDWPRRFDHMQQHTGQHLLSAVLANLFGHQTTAVHFGSESSTLDLNTATFTPEQVAQAVAAANAIVTQNRAVEVSFEEAEAVTGLRKTSERTGSLRIVTIRDLDRSACGGTHVRATGEIGAILIRKVERARKGVRLEFLCGQRAITRAHEDFVLLSRLAGDLSSSFSELPQVIAGAADRAQGIHCAPPEYSRETRPLPSPGALRCFDSGRSGDPESRGSAGRLVAGRPAGSGVCFHLPTNVDLRRHRREPSVHPARCFSGYRDRRRGFAQESARDGEWAGGGSARLAQGIVPGTSQLQEVVAALG